MSFVFVSHASPDKPRIRHIVDALIRDGHKVWLDVPSVMKYSPEEIRANFIRLHADRPWRDEIREALVVAGAVLGCWSEHLKSDRPVWHEEINYARVAGKLVACKVDGVDPTTLPDEHNRHQIAQVMEDLPEATLKAQLQLLLVDVRRQLAASAGKRLGARKPRDPFTPFLIDRKDQEGHLGQAIEETSKPGGVRAFLVSGPENECPDEFLERIKRYTCPRCVGSAWWDCWVEWPFGRDAATFATEYRRRLAERLELPYSADVAAIAGALARKDRAVAVVSMVAAAEWQTDEPSRLQAWLSFWHALSETSHRFSAIPILSVKMGPAEPGWTDCPSGRCPDGAVSYAEIWREAKKLETGGGKRGLFSMFAAEPPKLAPFTAVPLLHPVKKSHADTWLNGLSDDFASTVSPERRRLAEIVDRVFKAGTAAKHGVTLKDFAEETRAMFGDAG